MAPASKGALLNIQYYYCYYYYFIIIIIIIIQLYSYSNALYSIITPDSNPAHISTPQGA